MKPTMASRPADAPVRSLDDVHPTPARADILRTDRSDRRTATSDSWLDTSIGVVIAKAVVTHYGSVKAAALSMKRVDERLMMRELHAGKLGRLDDADDAPAVKADVAAALTRAFPPPDPVVHARRLVREAQVRLDEADDWLNRR